MATDTREEWRIVNKNGVASGIKLSGYVIDVPATAKLRDEMYPALAPHRAERREVTEGEWVAGRAAASPDPPDEDAIRADERERLSARVYENGWCPTCAAQPAPGGPIPGPDPGACPRCGEWRKAGMIHRCPAATPDPPDLGEGRCPTPGQPDARDPACPRCAGGAR